MSKTNPQRCLIISSRLPMHSAGLGNDIKTALQNKGIEVDFLTRYKDSSSDKSVIGIRPMPSDQILGISKNSFFYKAFRKLFGLLVPKKTKYIINNGIEIKYIDERDPDYHVDEILSCIKKKYDLIITLFWQDMINSTTLKAIYDNQKCPIMIYSPDMAPMTGGCFYFGNCSRYMYGCGQCPGLGSNSVNDQSNINIRVKRENYESSNIAFLGNTWMLDHFRVSYLNGSCRLFNVGLVLDEETFIPYDDYCKQHIRNSLNIKDDDFLIMIRSTPDIRKGNDDIHKGLQRLISQYQGLKNIKVITVGDSYFSKLSKNNNLAVIDFGQVQLDQLIDLYNISDVFISASIDDAGPSMINQSIMCGTPVISYNTGVAPDVIRNDVSGYLIPKGDYIQMSEKLKYLLTKTQEEYSALRASTRKIAYKNNSKESFVNTIISAYNEMLS